MIQNIPLITLTTVNHNFHCRYMCMASYHRFFFIASTVFTHYYHLHSDDHLLSRYLLLILSEGMEIPYYIDFCLCNSYTINFLQLLGVDTAMAYSCSLYYLEANHPHLLMSLVHFQRVIDHLLYANSSSLSSMYSLSFS